MQFDDHDWQTKLNVLHCSCIISLFIEIQLYTPSV